MYEYNAVITKIVDGDTVYASVDLGFNIKIIQCFRLSRVNAPELNTMEGKQAKIYLETNILNKEVVIKTIKDRKDKYGRFLAEIFLKGLCVNDFIVCQGFAEYKKY